MGKIIPAATRLAAKRAFVRTTTQAYGASIPTALTVGLISDALADPAKAAITVAAAALSPLLAGAASYFSFLGQGIPTEYDATSTAFSKPYPEDLP